MPWIFSGTELLRVWIYRLESCQQSRSWVERAWKSTLRSVINMKYWKMNFIFAMFFQPLLPGRSRAFSAQKCLHSGSWLRFLCRSRPLKQAFKWLLVEPSTMRLSTALSGSEFFLVSYFTYPFWDIISSFSSVIDHLSSVDLLIHECPQTSTLF